MRKKWIIRIGLAVIALVAFGGLYFYVAIWQPHHQFYRDEAWWKTATTNDQRRLCHRLISHRIGAHHDAFLQLQDIGNKDSVPLLIRALKWQAPPVGDGVVCTTGHCVGALRSLTGEDYGTDYRKWDEWWRSAGIGLPPAHFHERAANKAREETSEPAPSATSEPAPSADSSSPQG
jgi:hypothetical protein